jgi:hypothetical protein
MASLMVSLVLATGAQAADCNVAKVFDPECYTPRNIPVVEVFLVQYGEHGSTLAELQRAGDLLRTRFEASMSGALRLEFTGYAVIPLKTEKRDLASIIPMVGGDPAAKSPERLTRLWYYYNVEPMDLVKEIQAELLVAGYAPELGRSDGTLVLSEPQFEGLGFTLGAFGLTEQPSEIAWRVPDGGSTDFQNDPRLVDELLHELGHVLGLDHAAKHCYDDSIPPKDILKCCRESPGGNDVMSYCRDRTAVNNTFFFGFTSCTQDYLANVVRPELLNGLGRSFQSKACD